MILYAQLNKSYIHKIYDHINTTHQHKHTTINNNKTEDVVECKMDLGKGVGSLSCRMCSASYQMPIHHLHEPIDVFSEWLDDCEAAERGEIAAASASTSNNNRAASSSGNMSRVVHDTSQDHYDDDDSDDDRLLNESSGLGQKKRPADGGGDKSGDGGEGQKKASSTAALGLDDSDSDSD